MEISQAGQTGSGRPMPGVVSTPTQPATNDEGPVVRPKKVAEPSAPETEWNSLIDMGETEPSRDKTPAVGPTWRPPWFWPSVAVSALLFGLLIAWGIVVRVKTANGTIELVGLPKDAAVFVDGAEVAVTWPGGGKPAVITVDVGKHKIKVEKDGFEAYGEEVTVQAEGGKSLTVRLIRFAESRPTKDVTDDRTSRSDVPKTGAATVDPGVATTSAPPPIVTGNADSKSRTPEFLTTQIGQIKLKLIPAGKFLMGSADADKDALDSEKPQHEVRITRPFYLGVHEVTQGQYQAVMGQNPSQFRGSDDLPVEGVSWLDAVRFCNKLSEREGLKPYYRIGGDAVTIAGGDGYRLPTEAEWEYACRAGTTTRFSFGDDESALDQYAWYSANSKDQTHPVGEKQPNAFGLYDMQGNVFEWCWDGYHADYYKQSPANDPQGPERAANRVIRGGSWNYDLRLPRFARSAVRGWIVPEGRNCILGFRVARVQSSR